MRIAQKILLGLSVMVFLIGASSAYTYYATSRLTDIVQRLLRWELPALSRLDRLQNLIGVLHAHETRVLSDNRPEDHQLFVATADQTEVLIGAIEPLPFLRDNADAVEQFKTDVRTLLKDEREAVRLQDANDLFDARQMATQGIVDRLKVLRECTALQNECSAFLQSQELDNLRLAATLQQVSLAFAGISVLLALAMHWAGVRSLLKPLSSLVAASTDITQGNLERLAPQQGRDEFGELGNSFNQMVRNLRRRIEEVAQKHRDLQESQRLMQMQLRMSQNVQRRLVPQQPQAPGLDIAGRIQPAQRIGGDFYDVQTVGSMTTVAIGDASGHGIPAALMMVMAVTILREAGRQTSDPADVMSWVNRSLREQFQEESVDMFLTASYLVIDTTGGSISYSVAGHEPGLLLRGGGGDIEVLETKNLLLAFMDDATYQTECRPFGPGDRLVLYTDGLTESRNAEGEFFGRERLEAILQQAQALPSADLLNEIFEQVNSFRGDPMAVDDVTVLIVTMEDRKEAP